MLDVSGPQAGHLFDVPGVVLKLTLLGIDPSLGKGPQNLLVTPDGRHLLCANMAGDNVAVFRIDGESGALTPAGEPVAAVKPSCILWRP